MPQQCFHPIGAADALGWLNADAAFSPALAAFLAEHCFPPDNLEATIENLTTPLMRAARLARLDIVDELIGLGARLDARNADGNTALWLACFANDARVVHRLIEAGANLDNQNDNGATCLMYAASSGKAALVNVLLGAGANPRIANLDDFRAVELASTIECLHLLRYTAYVL